MQCRTTKRAEKGNVVEVVLPKSVSVDFKALTRHVFSASSCGLCGKATIEAVQQQFRPLRRAVRVSCARAAPAAERFASAQPTFQATGALQRDRAV